MDYHALHGYDIASFDISDTHRLPTVTASQALAELEDENSHNQISTGLEDLDHALSADDHNGMKSGSNCTCGVKRGQVTEIWGPPGSGKTAIGIQLAANCIATGGDVIWMDCFQDVETRRLKTVLRHVQSQRDSTDSQSGQGDSEANFTQYSCLTFAHFLAFLSKPLLKTSTKDPSLLVVESVSALVNSTLVRAQDAKPGNKPNGGHSASSQSTKRRQGIQSLMTSLQRYAATRNCAVVILSQCATVMHTERGAALSPSLSAKVWDQGVSSRLVLFRNWACDRTSRSVFLVGVQKLDGKAMHEGLEHVSAFEVSSTGVKSIHYDGDGSLGLLVHTTPRKRIRGEEVPDSEGEDEYGWADEDESALPPQPSQWQGSEDVILGHDVGRSDQDTDQDEDEDEEEPLSDVDAGTAANRVE